MGKIRAILILRISLLMAIFAVNHTVEGQNFTAPHFTNTIRPLPPRPLILNMTVTGANSYPANSGRFHFTYGGITNGTSPPTPGIGVSFTPSLPQGITCTFQYPLPSWSATSTSQSPRSINQTTTVHQGWYNEIQARVTRAYAQTLQQPTQTFQGVITISNSVGQVTHPIHLVVNRVPASGPQQTQTQQQAQNQNQTGSQQTFQQQWQQWKHQQLGTRILGRGLSTTLYTRFNPKTGIVEVRKNGIISHRGFLNFQSKDLNRRQALRNDRYR